MSGKQPVYDGQPGNQAKFWENPPPRQRNAAASRLSRSCTTARGNFLVLISILPACMCVRSAVVRDDLWKRDDRLSADVPHDRSLPRGPELTGQLGQLTDH